MGRKHLNSGFAAPAHLAHAIATERGELIGEQALDRLPILVRLVDFARARSSTPALCLRDYVRDVHDPDRAALFRRSLKDGNCLVMLDGLDEVIDPTQRAEIADQVEAFVADCPGNHFLVASRIVGYEGGRLTGDFVHFTLGPLSEESIRGFVTRWYEAIERHAGQDMSAETRASADALCQAIQDRPGIRRLAENPLLLTIIALANWKGGKLPNRRVEVYRHAAETLVESWPRRWRGVGFDTEEVLRLLEPVAYRILADQSSQDIREGDLLPLLMQSAVKTKPGLSAEGARDYIAGLLPQLGEHSGIFLARGFDVESGAQVFGFLHLTFAEYLAARHLAGLWEAQKDDALRCAFLARYAQVPRWREVVLLMASHIGLDGRRTQATQFLADVLQLRSLYEDALHRDLLLAGACLVDDLRVEPNAAQWVLEGLAALAVETPIRPLNAEILALAQALVGTAYETVMESALLARLENGSEDVRRAAAQALGQIKSERAVDGLLARLADDSETVRSAAARALGKIKSERAVDGLLARLADDNEEVRRAAAQALGELKAQKALSALLPWLSQTWHESVGSGRACELAYTAINRILAHHGAAPGTEVVPAVTRIAIKGPWSAP